MVDYCWQEHTDFSCKAVLSCKRVQIKEREKRGKKIGRIRGEKSEETEGDIKKGSELTFLMSFYSLFVP